MSQQHSDSATLPHRLRVASGENGTLLDLYHRYNRRLLRYCKRFLNDSEMADDVMQELWERVIRLKTRGKELPENPAGLLLTIARNLCIDALKRGRPKTPLHEIPESALPTFTMHEPSRMEELLMLALPKVRKSHRDVLTLYMSGYSVEEIAQTIGEPVGAVKMRALRARAAVRKIIAEAIAQENEIIEIGLERRGD